MSRIEAQAAANQKGITFATLATKGGKVVFELPEAAASVDRQKMGGIHMHIYGCGEDMCLCEDFDAGESFIC